MFGKIVARRRNGSLIDHGSITLASIPRMAAHHDLVVTAGTMVEFVSELFLRYHPQAEEFEGLPGPVVSYGQRLYWVYEWEIRPLSALEELAMTAEEDTE